MRRFIISALVLSAVTANAQVKDGMVGINTDEPRATMHIEPGVSESKGLIIPRITAAQMVTMTNLAHFGADHHAIITYLKETLPMADRTGKLVDVAEPGYYYYDNTTGVQKWKTFGGGAEQDFKALPTSWTGFYNYLTKRAGVGNNGSSLGTGRANIGIGGPSTFNLANSTDMTGSNNIGLGAGAFQFPNGGTMSANNTIGIGSNVYTLYNGGSLAGGANIGMGLGLYKFQKTNAQFSGINNIGIGQTIFDLQNGNFTGGSNIGMGNNLYKLISGNMAGESNIGIGQNSYFLQNGNITNSARSNIALGNAVYSLSNSSTSTISGAYNIGIGTGLYALSTGNLTGSGNIGMGRNVYNLLSAGDFSGNDNIGIGANVMRISGNISGTNNIGIGTNAMQISGNISGEDNIGIGTNAMQASGGIAGDHNIALGYNTMYTSGKVAGTDNIAIGYSALYPNANTDIGSYNIGIGNWALWGGMAKGNANIQLGNWYVGTPVAGQLNNVVAIGNEMNGLATSVADSDTILLGKTGSGAPRIGVGIFKPQSKLDVNGEVRVANEYGACTYDNRGAIRFDGTHFYGCTPSGWKQLDN